VDEDDVVRVDSNLVIIPASVVDSRGRAITDLKVDDFELRVDGEVKIIGDLSRSETPVHVALLFDNSASLSAAREFEKQAAVKFFRSVVRPIDRAAVYSISTTPTLAQGLTNDVPRLVRTVERFGKPDGATALFDAVTQAADYMRPLVGRKVLVLVSDGTDTVSDATFDDAVNRALRAECQVYVVQTRQVEDPNLHDPVSEQRMYRITEQTGGAVYIPRSVEELDAVFTQISLDLSQQYLLSYYPQDERKDRYFRFISVRVKTRPFLRVRARKGFYPAASAQGGPQATGERAQFSGSLTNTTRPDYVSEAAASTSNGASTSNDNASSYRRTAGAGGVVTVAPSRDAGALRRGKPGPDGPDTDDRANSGSDVNEPTPTFTLKTASSVATSKSAPVPEQAVVLTSPVETTTAPSSASTSATSSPTLTKSETDTPSQSSTADGVERQDVKASSVQQAATASRAAEDGAWKADVGSKAPVSGGVLNSKAISLPKPLYPAGAKTTGASGKVVVEVTIDEQGIVIEAHAVSGHPFLQKTAVQAARQARFTPATLSGEPVKVKGTINYVFTLP
jgi:Ca-activated chloride channel family protein